MARRPSGSSASNTSSARSASPPATRWRGCSSASAPWSRRPSGPAVRPGRAPDRPPPAPRRGRRGRRRGPGPDAGARGRRRPRRVPPARSAAPPRPRARATATPPSAPVPAATPPAAAAPSAPASTHGAHAAGVAAAPILDRLWIPSPRPSRAWAARARCSAAALADRSTWSGTSSRPGASGRPRCRQRQATRPPLSAEAGADAALAG